MRFRGGVRDANALIAYRLYLDPTALTESMSNRQVKSETVGPLSVSYGRPEYVLTLRVADVYDLVRQYLDLDVIGLGEVTGTDGRTRFEEEYGRSSGLS